MERPFDVKLSEDVRPLSEKLQDSAEAGELQRAVEDAERDITEGRWVEHPEVLAKLERWSAGEA